MSKTENNKSRREARRETEKRCANCFACKQDTELCPLNENYDPDAYLKWEEKYKSRREKANN